ncbi:MAG: sn-glycerol-3-phosphate ABC transporter ATP-binding protein UgpC [Chloroflexi bacterium]|nr:sn-glycerol-3-phosphate ABC transporter ATP-binding protein UgpC [Chloroflexota bacterium]
MASVTYDHVFKRYGNTIAVNDLSIEIVDKEFLVFVGPSGCGKSTSLRMLAGLEDISDGTLYIGDRPVNDVEPKDRDIAMVFQSYALYPHMSIAENMAFSLKLRKLDRAEIDQRVKKAAEILGLAQLLDRKPRQLSGGQRQRAAVGRAIVREPQVFLFDEPLSNLDAKLRVQTRAEISKLHRELGTTFIYVTHDQTEAMTMGSRIAVMKDGFLQQIDTPQHLYDRPTNAFVAGFIGSPSMNFFDVTISKSAGQLMAKGPGFTLPAPDRFSEPLTGYIGQKAVLGIRPEDLHDAEFVPSGIRGGTIQAQVDVTELMGNEVFLYLVTPGGQFVARVDPRTRAHIGNRVQMIANLDHVHFFDKTSEKAIR